MPLNRAVVCYTRCLAACNNGCASTCSCCNCCRMITSGVAGVLCLAAFCFLQTFISVYRGRLVSISLCRLERSIFAGVGACRVKCNCWQQQQLVERPVMQLAGELQLLTRIFCCSCLHKWPLSLLCTLAMALPRTCELYCRTSTAAAATLCQQPASA